LIFKNKYKKIYQILQKKLKKILIKFNKINKLVKIFNTLKFRKKMLNLDHIVLKDTQLKTIYLIIKKIFIINPMI
jgi:hypothetical protein